MNTPSSASRHFSITVISNGSATCAYTRAHFRRVRKIAIKATLIFVMLVCLSVRPHGTVRLPLDGFFIKLYTGCPSRNVPNFGRVFLRSNYTDITQNTYIQSSMVTEILAKEKCGILWCLRSILCP